MASRNFDPLMVLGKHYRVIAGSFAPNGTAAVSAASNLGHGWSVARTNTGEFTITFTDKFPQLISFTATLQQASAGDQFLQAGAYSASAKTLKVTAWDVSAGAAADVAADANNRVNFVAVFKNSTVGPHRGA